VQTVSEEQAHWKPGQASWSLSEVLNHLYNEERNDFRLHLNELLSDPPKPWGTLHAKWFEIKEHLRALEGFLVEREASLAWLGALVAPHWDITTQITFGPSSDPMVLSAGELLVSWVEQDYLHIRQINELLHAWNVQQAAPCSVE
jgi:hypothetical protein